MSKRESLSPEVIILEDEFVDTHTEEGVMFEVVHVGPFTLKQDESLCQQKQNEATTAKEFPFLFSLIAQEVEYPQHLQHMLSQAAPEDRALLHNFFVKVAVARREVS